MKNPITALRLKHPRVMTCIITCGAPAGIEAIVLGNATNCVVKDYLVAGTRTPPVSP